MAGLMKVERGKPNKVEIPAGTEATKGPHEYIPGTGYVEKPYVYQEYPRAIYRPRVVESVAAAKLLDDVVGVKKDDERNEIYLQTLQTIGENGYDIRQFPLQAPPDAQIRNLQNILVLHSQSEARASWLDAHPDKTAKDYQTYIESPETITVSGWDEIAKQSGNWFLDIACTRLVSELKPKAAVAGK